MSGSCGFPPGSRYTQTHVLDPHMSRFIQYSDMAEERKSRLLVVKTRLFRKLFKVKAQQLNPYKVNK